MELSVIQENLQAIADAGFTAIQTSPIMGSSSGGTGWASSYTPRNMVAGGNGNKFGDRDAFVSLTTAANALGIKVIVDVIANHMGAAANSDAPWNDSTYFHNVTGNVGYNDRFLLTQPEMISGLRDLDTHAKFVQDSYIAYLKDIIDAGASGFRYDAIKHIELDDDVPSPASIAAGATNPKYADGQFASDYIKNVTGAAKAYLEEKGRVNFQYGEVLQGGNPDMDRMQGYSKYVDLTASKYGHDVRSVLEVGDIGRLDKWADYGAEGLTPDRLVPWVESHDTYNNEGESLSFSPKQIRQGWAMIAARKDASPLFFARNINADGTQRANVRTSDNVANSRPQWTHPEVVAVNKFHNAMAGRDENLVSLGNNAVMIERGTNEAGGGAVLVNTSKTDRVLGSVPVKFLKDGFYVNALNPSDVFTVANGRISGTLPGNPAKVSNTDTNPNPGLVVLMDRESATPAILAAMPSDDDVIAGNSFTGNELKLRLSAVHVTEAMYAVNNGVAASFANDDIITVSANYNDPLTVTLMGRASGGNWMTREFTYTRVEPEKATAPPVAEPTHVNVYFSINRHANYQAWGTYTYGVRAYTFNPELFGGWPGGTMTRMKYNGADTHWYMIKMPRAAVGGIIFNTRTNADVQQQSNQPAITASMLNNEQLYFYGTSNTLTNYNINGSSDTGNNARANWDTAFAAGNNIGYAASGVFPPGRNGVMFNTSGGSAVANQYVRDGAKATRPATDPTRGGYLFDGKWYADAAMTQVYDFDKPVVNALGEDQIYAMTLYAGWIKLDADKALVDFNTQGGSPVMSVANVVYGTKIAAPQPPIRNGYTFGGWYKDAEFKNEWNFGADTVAASTTLFAKWNLVSYAIAYKDGAGSAVMPGTEPAAYSIVTPALDLIAPSPKEGYTFVGWFTDPQFKPSSKLTGIAEGSVGDLTLYARFDANRYNVALDPQSGSGGTASVSVSHGGKLPIGIAAPERAGYVFRGYYENTDGKGQQYYNSNGVRVFEGTWSTESVTSFNAHWVLQGDLDAETVKAAVAALEVGYAEGNDAALVTGNVTLPTAAAGDVSVTWSSDKPEVISAAGAVVRPAAGEPDAAVVLTATLTKGEATDKKTFTVVVKSLTIEDRTTLRQAIDAAQALQDGAVEGVNPGQYPAGSKAVLQAAIAAAETVYGNKAATAQQLDDALTAVASAADTFKKAVITQGPVITPDPATPTPTPTSTPTPTPTPAGDKKVVTTFNDEDLKRLSGDQVLSAAKDATQVLLPIQAADLTGNKPIRIQFNAVSVELPAEVLSAAQSSAAGRPADKTKIALEVAPVSQARAEQIQNAGLINRAAVKVVGQMYEFSLSVTTDGNEATKIGEFAKPLTLRFAVEGAVNPDLTGVYFIGGQNELQYAGGKLENNVIAAQVRHFSTYAVLEIDKRFSDVSESNWASPAIKSLAAKQIVNGTTETEFTPNRSVSRAEFAALLTRALGLRSTGSNPFNDVKKDAWYADAVAAVYEAGIVTGRDPQTFEPAKTITRQEAAVMLMRAYAFQSGNRDVPAAGAAFSDQAKISAWAQDAVSQANALGLLKGKGANVFMPQASLTRAEAAQIVYTLMNS